jgi:hypothetical protein
MHHQTTANFVSQDPELGCHSTKGHFYSNTKLRKVEVIGAVVLSFFLPSFEWSKDLVGQWVSIVG